MNPVEKTASTSPTTRRGGSNKFLAEGVGRLIVGSFDRGIVDCFTDGPSTDRSNDSDAVVSFATDNLPNPTTISRRYNVLQVIGDTD